MSLPRKYLALAGLLFCILTTSGCQSDEGNQFMRSFIHSNVEGQFDRLDASTRASEYRRRGYDAEAAQRRANFDFLWEHGHLP